MTDKTLEDLVLDMPRNMIAQAIREAGYMTWDDFVKVAEVCDWIGCKNGRIAFRKNPEEEWQRKDCPKCGGTGIQRKEGK